jgi:alpha-L-rhamnosidase
MARFAGLLGKNASPYLQKADTLKQLINQKFFNPDSALYSNGSQTALSVALYFNLVPEGFEQKVADNLVASVRANDHHLDFGVLGSKYVPAMLTKYGYVEDAFLMASRETAPSWGHWIMEKGMTTLAETWVLDPDLRDASLNHVFLGDISAWMFNALAGINYDENNPGFRHIIIRPHFPEELDWVKAEYKSVNGLIRSEWKREGNKIKLTVTIPGNTHATVYADEVKEVGSGKWEFEINQGV